MRNITTIALNTLRIFFLDRENLVGMLVLPVIFTFVLGFAFNTGGGESNVRVDIIDLDNSERSAEFIAAMKGIGGDAFVFCPMDNDEDDECGMGDETLTVEKSIERVTDEDISAAIIIPADYGDGLTAFNRDITIQYYSNEDVTSPGVTLRTLEAVIQQVNGSVVAARVGTGVADDLNADAFADDAAREDFTRSVYDKANEIWAGNPVDVTYTTSADGGATVQPAREGFEGFGQSVPGMGSMYVMFTVMAGIFLISRERNQWTLQRLVMMPVSRAQILGGNLLAFFILGMLQYSVVFAVGVLAGVNLGSNIIALILLMLAYTLCMTALALLLATFVRTEDQAGSLMNLVGLTLAPLGGAWWPLEIVPDFMKTIGHLSPVAWVMDGFRQLIYYNGGFSEVIVSVVVLLITASILFAIGVRRFRYE